MKLKTVATLGITAASFAAMVTLGTGTASAMNWEDCAPWGGVIAYHIVGPGNRAFCMCTLEDAHGKEQNLGVYGPSPDYFTPSVYCLGLAPGGGASGSMTLEPGKGR